MATYHSEHGDLHAIVTDHQPGRDAGDHRLIVAANEAAAKAGTGDWFVRWSVEGDAQGEFSK